MKKKQIIILSLILGILALGVLLKSRVRSGGDNAGAVQAGGVALAKFDPMKLEKILISRGSQAPSVDLAKENGVWKVKNLWNAKADPAKVEKLIQKFYSIRGELRSSGKKFFADYGIRDEEAFSIKFFSTGNASPQDFRIGINQAGENAFFVREATREDVYLAEVNVAELLGIYSASDEATSESLFWVDLSLFNLDPERVTKITLYLLKGEGKTMVAGLEREVDPKDPLKSSWKFMRKGMRSSPDPDKVLKFIALMNSIRAQQVVDPSGKGYGLEQPVWQLAITEEGQKTILNAGPKDEQRKIFYAKHLKDPTIFNVQASFFDDLNIDDTHFLKDIPSAIKPKTDSSQTISAGLLEEQGQMT